MSRRLQAAGAVLGAVLAAQADGAEPRRFPQVQADDLNGRELLLPQDFGGARNLVLIGFRQSQQADMDTWLARMPRFQALEPGLRWFECPIAPLSMRLMKPFIDGGMRAGVPDPAMRARTITLFVDKPAFRATLGLASEDRIHLLLLDREGRVLWSTSGPYNAAKAQSLETALRG